MAINTTKVANSEPVSDGFLLNSTNQYYIDVTCLLYTSPSPRDS